MKLKTLTIAGEYWFTSKYAAELLGTTRKKVEAMAARQLIRASQDGTLIAEADVTRLRRDPAALSALKKAATMPSYPKRETPMPRGTVYKGDAPTRLPKIRSTVGNPLADEGKG